VVQCFTEMGSDLCAALDQDAVERGR
jgi:hypothetical protein